MYVATAAVHNQQQQRNMAPSSRSQVQVGELPPVQCRKRFFHLVF